MTARTDPNANERIAWWNYRVVTDPDLDGDLAIYEAYYNASKELILIALCPCTPHGITPEEMAQDVEWLRLALKRPILKKPDVKPLTNPAYTDWHSFKFRKHLD